MTDIVKRLREPPLGTETSERNLMRDAADEIDRLRGVLEALSVKYLAESTECARLRTELKAHKAAAEIVAARS